jgi:cyclic pyranopterin phosphate synthase
MNDDELAPFVELTRKLDIDVRFIEYMPFDGNRWSDAKMMSYFEMRSKIEQRFELEPCAAEPESSSKMFSVPGFKGRVGFISSMTEHFCAACNRLRLTADGNLKVGILP